MDFNNAYDITPQMVQGIQRAIEAYREDGQLACPKTAAFLRSLNYDAVAAAMAIDDGAHTYNPPVFHVVRTNKFFNTMMAQFDDSWIGDWEFVWGDTFAFKGWLGVRGPLRSNATPKPMRGMSADVRTTARHERKSDGGCVARRCAGR